MSSVVIAGNTSGSITISAPDVSGSNTLTLPVATDTLVGKATADTLTNKTLVAPVLGAATATSIAVSGAVSATSIAVSGAVSGTTGTFTSTLGVTGAITGSSTVAGSTGILYPLTSGTTQTYPFSVPAHVDFTGIPSWVKRITVLFHRVGGSGTSPFLIQLGTGPTPTYTTSGYISNASSTNNGTSTIGFLLYQSIALSSWLNSGSFSIYNISGNLWIETGIIGNQLGNTNNPSAGSVTLGAALTAVRITTVNGTDTFDAGSINIFYE